MKRRLPLIAVIVAALLVALIWLIWGTMRPESRTAACASAVSVDGYVHVATRNPTSAVVHSYWLGPASNAPASLVKMPSLTLTPAHGEMFTMELVASGESVVDRHRVSVFVSVLGDKYQDTVPFDVRGHVTDGQTADLQAGRADLILVALSC